MTMHYIIWDFDGTLAYRPGRWSGALHDVMQHQCPGQLVDLDTIRRHLRSGFPWHNHRVPHPEIRGADEWWAKLNPKFVEVYEQLGCEEALAHSLAQQVRAMYTDVEHWHLYDDTVPVLEELSQRGWTHVMLSNHVPELASILHHLGLDKHIDQVFNSAETGYEKPHPVAFEQVRQAVGIVEQIWMVGDNPIADVAGAASVGLPAILVRKAGQTLRDVLSYIGDD